MGLNAAGKTYLFDAINWGLFGQCRYSTDVMSSVINKYAIDNNDLKIEIGINCYKIDEYGHRTEYFINRTQFFDKENEEIIYKKTDFTGLKKIPGTSSSININEQDFKFDLEKMIPKAVKEFYFLDGEELANLFSPIALENVKDLSIRLSAIPILIGLKELISKYQSKISKQISDSKKKDNEYSRKNEGLGQVREELQKLTDNLEKMNKQLIHRENIQIISES